MKVELLNMKVSKRKADRNELYGLYIKYFGRVQKIFTFEMFFKRRIKLICKQGKTKIILL